MTHDVSFCPRLMLKVRSHRPLCLPVWPLYTTTHSSMNLEPYHLRVTFMVGLFSNIFICCPRSSKSRIGPDVNPTVSIIHLISWMSDLSRHFYVFQMPSYFRIYLCPSLSILHDPYQDAITVSDLRQFLQELSKSTTIEHILIFNGPYYANRSLLVT